MTDERMYGFAIAHASLLLKFWEHPSNWHHLEPDGFFDETQDAICLAQQLIAEATGLVGTGDV